MKNFNILFAAFLSLCFFSSNTFSQSVTAQPYPTQYGKPFQYVPDTRDVNMYQVNTRAFSKEGNFKGVIARLDSIKALGINVVYLMPIYPVGILRATNSPYATKDYNTVGAEFGTLDDLRNLVDGIHKRKMAVILDWVGNHTSWDNPWIANKSWYVQDSTGNIKYPEGWKDVAQLNFKNQDMRLSMIWAMKAWVLKANVDGFRCDYADGPPSDFWKQAIDTLKHIKTHKLLFLAEGTRANNFTAGFDYNFGFKFYENLKKIYANGKSVKSIDTVNTEEYNNTQNVQGMVRYITNHDVNSSDGTPLKLFGGTNGSMAAFVVVAYMKGVPMIYNGQEIANPHALIFPFTKNHIDWTVENQQVTNEYKRVIAFRTNNETVRRGKLTSYSDNDVCAFIKSSGTHKILIFSNLRNKAVTYIVPSTISNSTWHDGFNGSKVSLKSSVVLEPYQYLVLKN